MADIFVSYARADRQRVAPLVAALEAKGFSVWWDPEIVGGQEFDALITRELEAAKAAIVVWTQASVNSRWVRGEARIAADRGVLVPVQIGAPSLPIDARAVHTIELDAWNEDLQSRPFQDLLRALGGFLEPAAVVAAAPGSGATRGVSICVLPFANMSGDPEQEYFADGISEDIITDLSKVSALSVIARNSAFAFKGKTLDITQVARQLGVTHVLEGSVRKSGARVRITAQLIDGAANDHLWAERYDRDLDDIFALQDEISEAIVKALKLKLLPAEKQAIEERGTANVEAHDLYLRARALAAQGGKLGLERALALFREATELDPRFAGAWGGVAFCSNNLILYAPGEADHLRHLGDDAFERAKALTSDPRSIELMRGFQFLIEPRDWIRAGELIERAEGTDPATPITGPFVSNGGAVAFFMACVGRTAQAVEFYESALRTDPLASTNSMMLQMALASMGRYEEADAEYRRATTLPIDTAILEYFALRVSMAREGRQGVKSRFRRYLAFKDGYMPIHAEVLAKYEDRDAVLKLVGDAFEDPVYQDVAHMLGLAHLAALFDDDALTLACLRRALVDMQGLTTPELWHPQMASVRKAEGFKDLVRDLGLYDYWRKSGHWGDFARPVGEEDFEIVR
jgi:adenylate cyclase